MGDLSQVMPTVHPYAGGVVGQGHGADYEIDLSKKNATRFRSQLEPYLDHARKAGRGQRRRPGRTPSSRQHSGAARAWAREQGITVSERGRIPASIIDQYEIAVGGA